MAQWVVGCWRGYLSGARCRLAYGPADTTATHCLLLQYKPRLVLPFWYRLTQVVPDKGPLNGCACVAQRGVPSVLWHCWLGVRKSMHPVKIGWWGVGVERGEVQIVCIWSCWCHCIPKPSHLLPDLNPDWFYRSGTSLPRLSWERGH